MFILCVEKNYGFFYVITNQLKVEISSDIAHVLILFIEYALDHILWIELLHYKRVLRVEYIIMSVLVAYLSYENCA